MSANGFRWPWSKEVDQARDEASRAAQKVAVDTVRNREIEQKAERAMQVTAQLRKHHQENGFTRLLKLSMGAR